MHFVNPATPATTCESHIGEGIIPPDLILPAFDIDLPSHLSWIFSPWHNNIQLELEIEHSETLKVYSILPVNTR